MIYAMSRFLFFAVCLLGVVFPSLSKADVLIEGEVDIMVKVLNTNEYPDYNFHIEYQGYYYEYGWQPGDIVVVPVKEGEEFLTGERGSTSKLFATDAEGKVYSSSIEMGGNTIVDNHNVNHLLHTYTIQGIDEDGIRLKLVNEFQVMNDGKVKKVKKGMAFTGVDVLGMDLGLILLPLVCLGGLVFFFWMRRNPVREQAA